MEIKDIPSHPNYFATSDGDIYSKNYNHTGKVQKLIPFITKDGYYLVDLWNDGTHRKLTIHRLIAKLFIPNPEKLPQINHRDRIKTHNWTSNLEWCTNLYNSHYDWSHGRTAKVGDKSAHHTLTGQQVLQIRELCKNDKLSKTQIAKMFGVSQPNISDIFHHKTWRHI